MAHSRSGFLSLLLACVLPALALLATGCKAEVMSAREMADGHLFKPTSRPVVSSPIAYDFTGNGVKEIAVGSWDGYFYLLDADLNDLPGWPQHSPRGFFSSPALADLSGDGVPEIIVGSDLGRLYGWRLDGSPAVGFPVDLGYQVWASPTVMEGPRIALGTDKLMYVFDHRGIPEPGWPQRLRGWPDATTAYVPGLLALTTLTSGDPSRGWIYAWREDGEILPGFPVELSKDSDSSPALADLNGDGNWWIVFGDDDGWLHVIDTAARPRPGFPVRTLGAVEGPTPTPAPPGGNVHSIEASPALGDLTGDGRLEIVVGSWDGRLYAWNDRGELLPGWPVATGDQIISSAALVDLDGDGRLDVVVGSKDRHLHGFTAEGAPLPGFPYHLGHHVFSSPWIGDIDGNGRADIVVGADNGIHLLKDVGPLGERAWPTFHRDERRTGALP